MRSMQVAQPVNPLTHSVGFSIRVVAITQVDQAQGLVIAVDEQRVEVRMPLLVTRAKGRLPVAGEAWMIDQTLGFWSLAAYVAPNIDALRNMLDLGIVQVDKLEFPSGVASESIPGQVQPSSGDVGLATEHAALIFRSPAMADPADNRVRMGLYSQNANSTSKAYVYFFDDATGILSMDQDKVFSYLPVFSGFNAEVRRTTDSTALSRGLAETVLSLTVMTLASRKYEITAGWFGIDSAGTTAAQPVYRMKLLRGSTAIVQRRLIGATVTNSQCGGTMSIVDTPGAGTFTYNLEFTHENVLGTSGSSAWVDCASDAPTTISIRGF